MTTKNAHKYLYYNTLFISLENPEVKSQPTGLSTFAITHKPISPTKNWRFNAPHQSR
jgi:hypothetical protein